jgi:hypothetical protein
MESRLRAPTIDQSNRHSFADGFWNVTPGFEALRSRPCGATPEGWVGGEVNFFVQFPRDAAMNKGSSVSQLVIRTLRTAGGGASNKQITQIQLP